MSEHASNVQESVSAIIEAAEAAAEKLRAETEQKMKERIAEGQRAAENRVTAAEEEAQDIVRWANEEAARLRETARTDGEKLKTEATSEALAMVARAQDQADIIRAEAEEAKTRATSEALEIVANAQRIADKAVSEANKRARETLQAARDSAGAVRAEGVELVDNLKEMGSSLRNNSERLLRDVQAIHSRMVAQIQRADTQSGHDGPIRASRTDPPARSRPSDPPLDAELEVPEFIPRG